MYKLNKVIVIVMCVPVKNKLISGLGLVASFDLQCSISHLRAMQFGIGHESRC
jgi:hypothetical protein